MNARHARRATVIAALVVALFSHVGCAGDASNVRGKRTGSSFGNFSFRYILPANGQLYLFNR